MSKTSLWMSGVTLLWESVFTFRFCRMQRIHLAHSRSPASAVSRLFHRCNHLQRALRDGMGDFKAFSSPIKRTDVENVPRFSFSLRVGKKRWQFCARVCQSQQFPRGGFLGSARKQMSLESQTASTDSTPRVRDNEPERVTVKYCLRVFEQTEALPPTLSDLPLRTTKSVAWCAPRSAATHNPPQCCSASLNRWERAFVQ